MLSLKLASWVSFIILILTLLSPLYFGTFIINDDLICVAYPWRIFYSQALTANQEFFWMPSLVNGYFVHGEGQVGMLHPFHLFLYRLLPVVAAFQIEVMIPYLFLFWGFKKWIERWLDKTPALFGAFCLVTSSFYALRFVHPNALQVTAHYPWLLIALDSVILGSDTRAKVRGALFWSVLIGSMILLGYPQYVFISMFLQGIYLFFRCSKEGLRDIFKYLIPAGILGTLLGAAQLLPTIEYFNDSERVNVGIDFISWGSLNPLQFFQWFGPYIYRGLSLFTTNFSSDTHEFGMYEGFFVLISLISLCFKRNKNNYDTQLMRFGLFLVFVGFFLSLGKYNGLFNLYWNIKPFSMFRYHSRTRVLMSFGLCIISTLVFWEICQKRFNLSRRWICFIPGVISCIIALISLLIKYSRPDLLHHYFSSWMILGTPLIFFMAGGFFYLGGAESRYGPLLILAFVACERSFYQFFYAFASQPMRIEFGLDDGGDKGRVYEYHNFGIYSGLRNSIGYLGVGQKKVLDYQSPKALEASAVKGSGRTQRYWLVGKTVISESPKIDIETINLSKTALVSEPLNLDENFEGGSDVKKIHESPGRFEFLTSTSSKQLLVISESYHRGWSAQVDGVNVRVYRVNGDFMGVVIPHGAHRIQVHFFPWSVKWGLSLSLMASFICFGFFLWAFEKTAKVSLKNILVGG